MAVLNPAQLADLRRDCAREQAAVNYTKPQINVALQAVEDTFEGVRPTLNSAINTATTPLVLTAAQKRLLVKYWLQQKFGRE